MGEYMRTLLNGLKAWVGGEINKLRAKIEAVATAASKTASLAAKNKTDIAELNQYTDEAYQKANAAQTTANEANALANTALQTANGAVSKASTAKTAADNAQASADSAKTAAATAQSTANNAVRPREDASGSTGVTWYAMYASSEEKSARINLGHSGGSSLMITVGPNKSPSVKVQMPTYEISTCDLEFITISGYARPYIKGIAGIVMHSNTAGSTKKFKITVSDDGTLSATEVTS